MTVADKEMYFNYDASGVPVSIVYNGTSYYYVTNLQGDVVGIVNQSGNQLVAYTYDAWGNVLTTTGSSAGSLGKYNPLRYRGYVYDTETKLYYLQSRYYNPEWGRFINADAFAATGQGLLGNNMFAYCGNNPTNYRDFTGHSRQFFMEKAIEGGSGGETFFAASAAFLGIYAFQMFEDAIQATSRLLTSAMSEVYQYSRSLVDASSSIYANHQPRVHHIVPWGDFSNRRAHSLIRDMQNILKEVEIDPRTDPLNLVVISQGYHAPLHKDSYFKSLHSALNSARGDREEVEKVLFYARIFIAFSDPYAKDFRRIFYA